MDHTLQEKYDLIRAAVLKNGSKNPIEIVQSVMREDFVGMHGPEHHFLDGAAFMTAYKNAGGDIDLDACLFELAKRAVKMPGAMCGHWGVCGSTASVGAALSVIHNTSPLSTDEYYRDNMEYTSMATAKIGELGGARCCKRNAFISIACGVKFVREKYGVEMELDEISCTFSPFNGQCLGARCPFHRAER